MAHFKSRIWNYFKVSSDNEAIAECKLCHEQSLSSKIIRGKSPKLFSTKPLWNHVKYKHPSVYKLQNESKADATENYNPNPDISELWDDNFFSQEQPQQSQHEPTLEIIIDCKKQWNSNDPRSKAISRKICEMMTLDAEPIALVEREGFSNLMKHLAPRYSLPNKTHFSQKLMPEIYKEIRTQVAVKLSTAKYISFTTDIWTSSVNNESFLSLTAHYISCDAFQREIHALSVKHFPVGHTGCNIADIINSIIEEWNIRIDQIHVIVRDDAANMILGIDLTVAESIGCFLQSLQLVVHDAIFVQRKIADIILKCRKIVSHFNSSSLACKKLKKIQENLKLPIHNLIQDVVTPWNSTFYMLSRLYEQKQAVTAYATEHDIPTFDAHQWRLIGKIVIVLQPIEEITKIASVDNENIGYVIPAIATLRSYLSKRAQSQDNDIATLKDDLKKSIENRFLNSARVNIQDISCFTHATFLDPRFKTRFLKDEIKVKKLIVDELLAIDGTNDEEQDNKDNIAVSTNNAWSSFESNLHDAAHESIWKCFDEIANGSKLDINTSTEEGNNVSFKRQPSDRTKKKTIAFTAEVDKYLAIPLISRIEDPVLWWKTHASEFPNLKILFIKYCGAPSSSVNSERLFSAAAAIYKEDRNRLLPDNAEMLIFLMKNMKYLKNV